MKMVREPGDDLWRIAAAVEQQHRRGSIERQIDWSCAYDDAVGAQRSTFKRAALEKNSIGSSNNGDGGDARDKPQHDRSVPPDRGVHFAAPAINAA